MPYKPRERLYRNFAASNFKPVVASADIGDEEEVDEEPSYKVRGYYTVWGAEYLLYPAIPSANWPAEYEKVDRSALDGTDVSDVIFQENHEGSPLARIRNGSLTLGTDEHGAWCEAYLGGCQRGRELYESICNGLIVEMSFGFTIADDDNGVGMTTTRDEQGDYHTTITRISKIFDVSGVSIPASHYTEISELRTRSAASATIEADIEAEKRRIEAAEEEERQRKLEEEERAKAEERAKHDLEMLRLRAKLIGIA